MPLDVFTLCRVFWDCNVITWREDSLLVEFPACSCQGDLLFHLRGAMGLFRSPLAISSFCLLMPMLCLIIDKIPLELEGRVQPWMCASLAPSERQKYTALLPLTPISPGDTEDLFACAGPPACKGKITLAPTCLSGSDGKINASVSTKSSEFLGWKALCK